MYAFREKGDELFLTDWESWNGSNFNWVWHDNCKQFVNVPALDNYDVIWVCKTKNYFKRVDTLRNMLHHLKKSSAVIVNDPATIEHNINKSYLWELEAQGVDIVPTKLLTLQAISEMTSQYPCIIKPKCGALAHGVSLLHASEEFHQLSISDYDTC